MILDADVHPHDVRCGRGHGANRWPGNIWFRKVVEDHSTSYHREKTYFKKACVAKNILAIIKGQSPRGRFIERDASIDQWIEISDEKAEKKIKQALRDCAPDCTSEKCSDDDVDSTGGNKKEAGAFTVSSTIDTSLVSAVRNIEAAYIPEQKETCEGEYEGETDMNNIFQPQAEDSPNHDDVKDVNDLCMTGRMKSCTRRGSSSSFMSMSISSMNGNASDTFHADKFAWNSDPNLLQMDIGILSNDNDAEVVGSVGFNDSMGTIVMMPELNQGEESESYYEPPTHGKCISHFPKSA